MDSSLPRLSSIIWCFTVSCLALLLLYHAAVSTPLTLSSFPGFSSSSFLESSFLTSDSPGVQDDLLMIDSMKYLPMRRFGGSTR